MRYTGKYVTWGDNPLDGGEREKERITKKAKKEDMKTNINIPLFTYLFFMV
jgi:hypothetical protein